jgi:hypothetical protein
LNARHGPSDPALLDLVCVRVTPRFRRGDSVSAPKSWRGKARIIEAKTVEIGYHGRFTGLFASYGGESMEGISAMLNMRDNMRIGG